MSPPSARFQDALRRASDVLMYTFDFEPLPVPMELRGIDCGEARSWVFGCDATCGRYVWCESAAQEHYALHLDARGWLRVLATSQPMALRMIVELPYFRELLAESGRGGLSAMRTVARRLEHEVLDDIGALPEARRFIVSELGLPEVADPVLELYRLGVQCPISVTGEDGIEFLSELREPARRSA